MHLTNFFIVFVIGAVIGSFLNVCIYRLPKNLDIVSTRSFCPKCNKQIKWHDNIPLISFVILKFKCRWCKKPISWTYLLVELISALFMCLALFTFQSLLDILIITIIFYTFIIIFFIDIKNYIIPDSLNFFLIFLGIIKNFFPDTSLNLNQDMFQSLTGGALGYFIIWLIIFLYKKIKNVEAMGMGDAKLLSALGFLLGFQSIFPILFIASILGLVFSMPNLILGKSSLKSSLPFGPFLILASIICYFYF